METEIISPLPIPALLVVFFFAPIPWEQRRQPGPQGLLAFHIGKREDPRDEVAEALKSIPFHCHPINTVQKK